MKRRIVVGSMIRSGSTMIYNAIRMMSELRGFTTYCERAEFYDPHAPADVHVVRAHVFEERLLPADVVTTIRNPLDCIASAIQLGMVPYDTYKAHGLRRVIRRHIVQWIISPPILWGQRAMHKIDYTDICDDLEDVLYKLGKKLFPETKFSLRTLMHRLEQLPLVATDPCYGYAAGGRHRTNTGIDGYKAVLEPGDIAELARSTDGVYALTRK